MPSPSLDRLRIILVEPAGARNVGSIARIMKNMGLRRLVLVNPQCDFQGDEARHMAVHGQDVLAAAAVVNSLPEALQGCRKAIATAGRETTLAIPIEPPKEALPWLLADEPPVETALIFGREDRGLTNEELNLAQRLLQIPSSPEYPSLNLAQAVAICSYELYTLSHLSNSHSSLPTPHSSVPAAPLDQRESFYRHLEALLLKIGYLYPHTASSRMEKFRGLLNRSQPSEQELAMLRGVLRQVEWALQSGQFQQFNGAAAKQITDSTENLLETDDSHQH